MIRETLEKMFEDEFGDLGQINVYNSEGKAIGYRNNNQEVKQFIFDKLLQEILKEIVPTMKDTQTKDDEINYMRYGYNDCIDEIQQKAKELGINI